MGRLAIQAARTARPARSHPQSGGTMSLPRQDPRQQASRDPVLPGSHARSGQGTAARAGASRQAGQTPASPGKSSACRTCTAAPRSMSPQALRQRRAWSHRRPREVRRRRAPGRITPQIHVMLQHRCRKGRSSPMARQPPRSFRDHQNGFRTQCRCNGHRFSEGRRTVPIALRVRAARNRLISTRCAADGRARSAVPIWEPAA